MKSNKELTAYINKDAPWVAVKKRLAPLKGADQAAFGKIFNDVSVRLEELAKTGEYLDWATTWIKIEEAGYLQEIAEITNRPLTQVCMDFQRSYSIFNPLCRTYKLMRKYNQLSLTCVSVELWKIHTTALETLLEKNAKEKAYWDPTFEQLPFSHIGFMYFQAMQEPRK